jgi:hypothetical protein
MSYQTATSDQLNAMSLSQLSSFTIIVWPGGDSNQMDASLTSTTKSRVRQAVQSGVNYVGFCAGAWMAVGPAPGASNSGWGFSLVTGDYLKEYAPGGQYPVSAIVPVTFATGQTRDLVWWDGPYLPTLAGSVIARYPGGSAAMIEARSGQGYVVLSGVHPEAPMDWRTTQNLTDPDGLDFDIAWSLVNAALTRTPLSVF